MRLDDGFPCKVTFADFPTVYFNIKDVTPSGTSGGGPIDTTDMDHDTFLYRTNFPKKLKSKTPLSLIVAYDVKFFDPTIGDAMVNHNQLITVKFADGAEQDFWGYLNDYMPGPHSQNEDQPTMTIQIIPTLQNNSKTKILPVWRDAP